MMQQGADSTSEWKPIDSSITLGELRLKVSDLSRALEFYVGVLGFVRLSEVNAVESAYATHASNDADALHASASVASDAANAANAVNATGAADTAVGKSVSLTVGGQADDGREVLLTLEEVPNAVITRQRSRSGLYHFAVLLPDRVALGAVIRQLTAHGIRLGQADHNVSEAIYLSDPDGNGIEIYRDRPREEWTYDEQGGIVMGSDPLDWQALLKLGAQSAWQGMPVGTRIGHVHFHVGSLEAAHAFYVQGLGFKVEADYSRQMRALFIAAGGYHHHIGLNTWAGEGAPPTPDNGTGLRQYTILFGSAAEQEQAARQLAATGAEVRWRNGQAFALDPAGIEVRLAARRLVR